jgi:hypothetical protein
VYLRRSFGHFPVKTAPQVLPIKLKHMLRTLKILWAFPLTLFGIIPALAVWLARGHMHRVHGALEFHGPLGDWILRRPYINCVAVTIGHIIIGRDETCCARARIHEHTHVHQGERWGPLFPLAYCAAGLYQIVNGRRFYWDNPFEIEARVASARESQRAR